MLRRKRNLIVGNAARADSAAENDAVFGIPDEIAEAFTELERRTRGSSPPEGNSRAVSDVAPKGAAEDLDEPDDAFLKRQPESSR